MAIESSGCEYVYISADIGLWGSGVGPLGWVSAHHLWVVNRKLSLVIIRYWLVTGACHEWIGITDQSLATSHSWLVIIDKSLVIGHLWPVTGGR